jgi:hypothetical protein
MKRDQVPAKEPALYPTHFPANNEMFFVKGPKDVSELAYIVNGASDGMRKVWDTMFGKTFAKAMHVSQRLHVRGLSSTNKSILQKE